MILTQENKIESPRNSIYKIEEGTIFLLTNPRRKYNRKLGYVCDHNIYIWIQKKLTTKRLPNTKHHKVRILEIGIPVLQGHKLKYSGWEGKLFLGTLRKYLKDGYKIIATDVKFNYSQESYARFYNRIDLVVK